MGIKLSNNAFGTLAASINSSATSITLTTGQGARFPTLAGGDYFYATLVDTSNNLEIVKCTARSTDVLTVVRAQESTTARAYSTGDRIEIRLTAQTFIDAVNEIGPTQISDEANTSTGYLDLPHGTTAQRPGSPSVGYTRYNTDLGLVESYHGVAKGWVALSNIFQATGGTETTYTSGGVTYKVHTFTSSGTFTVQSGSTTVDALVVAGGGGGGGNRGAGAGAGGVVIATPTASTGSYTITIGGGGNGGTPTAPQRGTSGANTTALGLTAVGGGAGGGDDNTLASGFNGGSGGGAAAWDNAVPGSGTSGQGNAGGTVPSNAYSAGGPYYGASGGGGASAVGQNGTSVKGGNGGNGVSSSINGTATTYGGGGGGGTYNSTSTGGSGGTGGGGNSGSFGASNLAGSPGSANTGGGGGGGCNGPTYNLGGGNGGSGIVIIRYAI